jgi:NTP pyrophosphatase (non-canonical NTP hydrolase)
MHQLKGKMTKKVDLDKYLNFVDGVTSDPSKDYKSFIESLHHLNGEGSNINRLATAGVGLAAESGEFLEIVKKMVFQGKPWNADNREHLIIELGDVLWYVAQACMALEVSFDDVVAGNVEKLKKRYPGGEFNVYHSENRAEGDR